MVGNRLGSRVVMLLVLSILTVGARAHTGLSGSSPADGESLAQSPEALVLEFPMPVRLVKVELSSAAGAAIDLGKYRVTDAATSFRVVLPPLAPASYRVEWMVMGGDSHKMTGSLGFTVEAD